jgi:hypothetical protein
MRTIIIEGNVYQRKEIRRLRREQIQAARKLQPTLFELRTDARPASQRTANGRFTEPTLFPLT